MAVLKSKDFPQIRKLVKLCGKFVVVNEIEAYIDVTHKKGRFSTRWRTSHAPASQARDSTRPRGARARRARRRRGLRPVWRNSTRGAARASQHTRSRPAPSPSAPARPDQRQDRFASGAHAARRRAHSRAASPHKCMMTDARSEGGRRRRHGHIASLKDGSDTTSR